MPHLRGTQNSCCWFLKDKKALWARWRERVYSPAEWAAEQIWHPWMAESISYSTHRHSFHFLLFFLLILFLAWFALSPSNTSPDQCSRSGWKNGQPQSHIHLNHFNANIDRKSTDTGWDAFFLMGMLFFWGCATHDKTDHHRSESHHLLAQKCLRKFARWATFSAKLVSLSSACFSSLWDQSFLPTYTSLLILPRWTILRHNISEWVWHVVPQEWLCNNAHYSTIFNSCVRVRKILKALYQKASVQGIFSNRIQVWAEIQTQRSRAGRNSKGHFEIWY